MSAEVVEVIYGKHQIYEVIRVSTWLGVEYRVRTVDGKFRTTLSRLDKAVAYARERARKY